MKVSIEQQYTFRFIFLIAISACSYFYYIPFFFTYKGQSAGKDCLGCFAGQSVNLSFCPGRAGSRNISETHVASTSTPGILFVTRSLIERFSHVQRLPYYASSSMKSIAAKQWCDEGKWQLFHMYFNYSSVLNGGVTKIE